MLAGCSSAESEPDAATELLFSAEPTQTALPSPGANADGDAAATLAPLPEDCRGVIRTEDVVRIVGVALPGDTTFVFADELPEIGRTGRVTCGYGDEGDGATVEVTVNDYASAEAALERVDITLEAASERGNEVRDQPVGPYDGYVLSDDEDVSLVVTVESRTVVITMPRDLVTSQAELVVLERLATEVLGLPTATVEPTPAP